MRSFIAVIAIACIFSVVYGDKLVNVVALTESLCPNCMDFINSDFKQLMRAEGVFDRVVLQFLSWGNAYTETTSSELCPSPTPGKYDVDVRKCWNARCVRNAKPELFAECFNKSFDSKITCQHGEDECIGNRIETCAVQMTMNKTFHSMSRIGADFIACFSGDYRGRKEYAEKCAKLAGIDYNALTKCVDGPQGTALLSEEAVETNDYGVHPGVPYVLVAGEVLPDNKSLLKAVCEKLDKATLPAGCNSNLGNNGHKWSSMS